MSPCVRYGASRVVRAPGGAAARPCAAGQAGRRPVRSVRAFAFSCGIATRMSGRVVVVEDETLTRRAFAIALGDGGFEVIEASDAYACRAAMRQARRVDVVLVDLGLPGVDGLTLVNELRQRTDVGLMVVSRTSEPETRIEALERGVDDFLVKPVHLGELVARVKSLMRRRQGFRAPAVTLGPWVIDPGQRTVRGEGRDAQLTRGEFDLLSRLIEGGGKIVSREDLLSSISTTPEASDPRSVDALISRLRRKLGDNGDQDSLILTAPGFGYRLAQPARTPP